MQGKPGEPDADAEEAGKKADVVTGDPGKKAEVKKASKKVKAEKADDATDPPGKVSAGPLDLGKLLADARSAFKGEAGTTGDD